LDNEFYYAGIGSRSTPEDIGKLMGSFAYVTAYNGGILRSGGAGGADQWFEIGSLLAGVEPELYFPWPGFSGKRLGTLDQPEPAAYEIAKLYHPAWNRLSQGAKALIARNSYQVLGPTLDDPVAFVICWTPDGSVGKTTAKTGGTGQALRIASDLDIPIFNLKRSDHLAEIREIADNNV
jgi:hypothetical protein